MVKKNDMSDWDLAAKEGKYAYMGNSINNYLTLGIIMGILFIIFLIILINILGR